MVQFTPLSPTSVVISWRQKKNRTRKMPTELPVATRILPDVYGDYTDTPGCIRWLYGYSRMYTVAIRRLPGCIRWLHGDSRMNTVATRRYTAPTRSNTDHFSSVYSGTKNWAGLIFSPDMPDHAGWRRMPSRLSTRMMPVITRIKIRDDPGCDPWMCESPFTWPSSLTSQWKTNKQTKHPLHARARARARARVCVYIYMCVCVFVLCGCVCVCVCVCIPVTEKSGFYIIKKKKH